MCEPSAISPLPVPFHAEPVTVAPSKSRKIVLLAPGRLCRANVWLVGYAGAVVAADSRVPGAGASSW